MIVILDNIRSVHNVGSIFRTADALGIEKIILAGITPAPIDRFGLPNSQLSKVALGAEKTVAWRQVPSVAEALTLAKKQGYAVVAIEQAATSISLFDPQLPERIHQPIALIMGAEVGGIDSEILRQVDFIVEIPMHGSKESLNVSVAFGIAAYVLSYQVIKFVKL